MTNPSTPCRKVLIVEDEEEASFLIHRALKARGYDSYVAENGEQALSFLRTNANPCVVLLDLMMPVMSGQEFRETQLGDPALSAIPVVVVSAANDIQDESKRMKVSEYLKKPIDMAKLFKFVERYCGKGA